MIDHIKNFPKINETLLIKNRTDLPQVISYITKKEKENVFSVLRGWVEDVNEKSSNCLIKLASELEKEDKVIGIK